MRTLTKDLEFDLAPAEAASDPLSSSSLHPASASNQRGTRQEIVFDGSSDRLELDLEHGKPATKEPLRSLGPRGESMPAASRAKTGSFQRPAKASGGAERPEPQASAARPEEAGEGAGAAPAAGLREATQARAQPAAAERVGGGPMSRAAVVQPVAAKVRDPRKRQLALLRMLAGLLIAACGIWLDSSVVYGNANLISVLAHAVGIYQLGLGAWGLRA
jgi:hypothetical protein